MGGKDIERLLGKLLSMHLSVIGAVAHIYHIQRALAQAGADRSWLSPDSHRDVADWRILAEQTADPSTHLAEIVRRKPTHMGFCNASGLRAGGIWIDLSCSGKDLVWLHPWTVDIIANLVSSTNKDGKITNSDQKIAVFFLHESTLLAAVPDARLAAPHSGSDNTPTVSWSTKHALTINLVVLDLLHLRTLHSR